MDGNKLDDCEEVADVDIAPDEALQWLRYIFRRETFLYLPTRVVEGGPSLLLAVDWCRWRWGQWGRGGSPEPPPFCSECREAALDAGISLEELRAIEFEDVDTSGLPATMAMALKVQRLVDIKAAQLRVNKAGFSLGLLCVWVRCSRGTWLRPRGDLTGPA